MKIHLEIHGCHACITFFRKILNSSEIDFRYEYSKLSLTSTYLFVFTDYVHQMLLKAEKKTLQILNSAFGSVSSSTDETVKTFFNDLSQYVSNGTAALEGTGGVNRAAEISRASATSSPDNRLAQITNTLFVRIFPLIYQTTLAQRQRVLHPEYRACLEDRIGEIKPFSEITKMLEKDVSKTFEATKVLIASLNFGSQLLNQSSQLILSTFSGPACYDALLQMTYCNHCNGHGIGVKPCSGYCLNVMRGCLSQPAAEMDSSWNGFYEAVDKLISLVNRGQSLICLEDLLRSLHSRIAEPILYFSEQHLTVHSKVSILSNFYFRADSGANFEPAKTTVCISANFFFRFVTLYSFSI